MTHTSLIVVATGTTILRRRIVDLQGPSSAIAQLRLGGV